jgi:hypothetical protein
VRLRGVSHEAFGMLYVNHPCREQSLLVYSFVVSFDMNRLGELDKKTHYVCNNCANFEFKVADQS